MNFCVVLFREMKFKDSYFVYLWQRWYMRISFSKSDASCEFSFIMPIDMIYIQNGMRGRKPYIIIPKHKNFMDSNQILFRHHTSGDHQCNLLRWADSSASPQTIPDPNPQRMMMNLHVYKTGGTKTCPYKFLRTRGSSHPWWTLFRFLCPKI